MPGSTPPTSQLEWLSSTTAMIVLFWSRATRDLLRSFGWGIAALHRLDAATKLPRPRRPPHSIFQGAGVVVESPPASDMVIAEMQRRAPIRQQGAKTFLAHRNRHGGDRFTIEVEEIEQEKD